MIHTIAVLGATATGKTSLAMRLADALGGEIINADALQVYRHFDIGTAKPSALERSQVRHHLIDVLDPTEPFSAGEFARRATEAARDIASRGKVPLVVGGSGLYLRALFEGLASLPEVPPELRLELKSELAAQGLEALRLELTTVDPATAERLGHGDTQRILRALEVYRVSGKPLSQWIAEQKPVSSRALEATKIGLTLPRAHLYDKISARARAMLAAGWVEEVERLMSLYPLDAPAFQAIGYRELVRALVAHKTDTHPIGQTSSATAEDLEFAVDQILVSTRRYAKRQETWFRKEEGIRWLNPIEIEPIFDELISTLLINLNPM